MLLNLLVTPFWGLLVSPLQAGEGLNWRQAVKRSLLIFRQHRTLVVGLLAAWLCLPWMLAILFQASVEAALPYLWGIFDVELNLRAWAEPCVWAVQCLLASLVLPGFELAIGLFLREYSLVSEGADLMSALEREYAP